MPPNRPDAPAPDGGLEVLFPGIERTELQARVLATDWAGTPLGAVQEWSPTLRTAVGLCLASRFPMLLAWGPELVMIYNDGYAAMLGDRHPAALGRSLPEVWADVWPVIDGMVSNVLAGEATFSEDLPLSMTRFGFDEETWFTFSYSPVREPGGRVAGLLDTAVETTSRVLGARRLEMLRRLGSLARSDNATASEACVAVLKVLGEEPADCPFGVVYLTGRGSDRVSAVAGFGVDTGGEPAGLLEGWAREAIGTGQPVTGVGLAARWPGVFRVPAGPLGDAEVQVAVALPLVLPGQGAPIGSLVLGVSPRLHLDEEFRAYLDLLAGQVAAAVTDARAAELERSRAVERAALAQQRARFLGEVAVTLQRSVLGPTVLPEGFAAHYEPATQALEVGGDWYDVVDLAAGQIGIVVGDVVGRGLDAAAVMGQLRSAVRALLLESRSPVQVLTALDTFAGLVPGAVCSTVFCAVVDTATGRVHYSNAGHLPAVVVDRDGRASSLDGGRGLPLAVAEASPRGEADVHLAAGATLLLFTDGLVERRHEVIDDGIARAETALAAVRHLPPGEAAGRMRELLLADAGDDDVAFLLYRRPGAPVPRRAGDRTAAPA